MNKQDELQAKRDELQAHSLETVNRLSELDLEIEELIAENAKPVKRSGDCCLAGGVPCIIIGNGKGSKQVFADGGVSHIGHARHVCKVNPLFNAFDDLKAMQEDVTRDDDLEMERYDKTNDQNQYIQLGLSSEGELFISTDKEINGTVYHLKGEELAKVRRYIQRAEATLKRQQK